MWHAAETPDDEIVKALELKPAPDSDGYAIEGDPFCEVHENLLNDGDEVEAAARSAAKALVITNSDGTIGVEAIPPFGPDCAKQARHALNRLG